MRSASAKAGLAVMATLLALGLAELFLICFYPVTFRRPPDAAGDWKERLHRASSLPGLAYELAPGREVVHWNRVVRTNRFGLRGAEVSAPGQTTALRRIAVIGDSVTFGFGVDAEQTYVARLEAMIESERPAGEPGTEVLNFGVGGYSTRDEAIVLRERALDFEPELVIVGYVLNDPETRPIQPLHGHFAKPRWWQSFHLARLVARLDHTLRIERFGGGDYVRSLYAEGNGLWPGVVESFDDMADGVAESGTPVLLVIFPDLKHWSAADYARGDLHEKVAAAGRAAGFSVLDIADVYRGRPAAQLRLPGDVLHPSPLGHELVAAAIHARMHAEPRLFHDSR